MKTVLLFTAACALVCTTYAAPRGPREYNRDEAQRENDLAKEQFHFHIYNRDDMNKLKDIVAAQGNQYKLAKDQFHFHVYDRNNRVAGQGNELATDQFHLHIYDPMGRVAERGNEFSDKDAEQKAKEQFHFHVYNRKDANKDAERALLESLLE